MSRKIFALLFALAISTPVFAEYQHSRMSVDHNEGLTTTAETIYASPCEVAYIIVESTGQSVTYASTVRLLNSGTTVFSMTLGASTTGETLVIDLTATPVYFSTNLIIDSSAINAVGRTTVVYKKLN